MCKKNIIKQKVFERCWSLSSFQEYNGIDHVLVMLIQINKCKNRHRMRNDIVFV